MQNILNRLLRVRSVQKSLNILLNSFQSTQLRENNLRSGMIRFLELINSLDIFSLSVLEDKFVLVLTQQHVVISKLS